MGYYFAILSFSFLSSAILAPIMFRKCPRKLQFCVCFFVSTFALAFLGPSKLLGFNPDHFYLVLIGLPLLGFVQALCFIPSLPEAIEAYQIKYKIVQQVNPTLDGKLSDIMSSGYGLFYNAASLIGPVLGGTLYSSYGY